MQKNHYICIPAIDIDSVLKIEERAYPQAYLEQCKYKLKKKKLKIISTLKLLMKIMILMMLLIVM